MIRAMQSALEQAGITADQIDYVNAHATGTTLGDISEAEAVSSVISASVPVSSMKGHVGHMLGASGA